MPAAGGFGAIDDTELKQHLGETWQRKPVSYQAPYLRRLQWLRVQAGENPSCRRVKEQALQCLTGPEPVSPAITERQQDCGGGGRAALGGFESYAAPEIEVALPQPARLTGRVRGETPHPLQRGFARLVDSG